MKRRTALAAIAASALVAGSVGYAVSRRTTTGPSPRVPRAAVVSSSCAETPTSTITLTGQQAKWDGDRYPIRSGSLIDATQASWTQPNSYQVLLRDAHGDTDSNLCWDGGYVTTPFPQTDLWSLWHRRTGVEVDEPGAELENLHVNNDGDGVDFGNTATNWELEGVHISDSHDDCVQDDSMNSGVITDSYLDGCYSGISAMGFTGYTRDGSANTLTIDHSLISLADFPSVTSGPEPGHAGFFKFAGQLATQGRAPNLIIDNSYFLATDTSSVGTMGLPMWQDPATGAWTSYLTSCANDVMVWLGPGNYPKPLPSCFTVETNTNAWDYVLYGWLNSHKAAS